MDATTTAGAVAEIPAGLALEAEYLRIRRDLRLLGLFPGETPGRKAVMRRSKVKMAEFAEVARAVGTPRAAWLVGDLDREADAAVKAMLAADLADLERATPDRGDPAGEPEFAHAASDAGEAIR